MTLKELYSKFKKIPAKKWIKNKLIDSQGNCCAYGHMTFTLDIPMDDRVNLNDSLKQKGINIINVNNGIDNRFQQKSIRARVLAAIKSVY